jgi:hypothetical protein
VAGAGESVVWSSVGAGDLVPFTVRSSVGRVVALRIRRLRHVEDVHCLTRLLHEAARDVGTDTIIFSDCRRTMPVPQEVADEWSRHMREFNKRLARTGILLDRENETFNLQLERVVRCAGNPVRRVFYDPRELREWLSHALTAAEMSLIDELLAVS